MHVLYHHHQGLNDVDVDDDDDDDELMDATRWLFWKYTERMRETISSRSSLGVPNYIAFIIIEWIFVVCTRPLPPRIP